MSSVFDRPKDEAPANGAAPKAAPVFGAVPGGIAFGAVTEDADAMCVRDGDAVVCTPVSNDKD